MPFERSEGCGSHASSLIAPLQTRSRGSAARGARTSGSPRSFLIGSIQPQELVCVLADEYSTPDEVHFEAEVRQTVNVRLGRLAVTSVCRLDSRAAVPLQIVDLLTAAVAFEFRQDLGLAGTNSPKAHLARYVREAYSVSSFLRGVDRSGVNVKIYRGRTRVVGTP